MFKKKTNILFVLLLIAGIALPSAAYAKKEKGEWPSTKIVIRIPHEVVSSQPKHKGLLLFKKQVEAAFPGKVNVRVFPSGQLMSDSKALDGCRTGAVEMAFPITCRFAKYDKRITILGMPYLFPSTEARMAVVDSELGRLVKKIAEDDGFHVLGMAIHGITGPAAKERILTSADYVGKKTRIFDTTCQAAAIEKLGGSCVTMAASEYAAAIQQGVVDAVITSESGWYGTLKSIAPYLTISHMFGGHYVFVCGQDWYDSMPKELQDVMDKAGRAATDYVSKTQIEADEELFREFGTTDPNKKGIYVQSPEEYAELMEKTESCYKEMIPIYGKELIDAALDYRAKYK